MRLFRFAFALAIVSGWFVMLGAQTVGAAGTCTMPFSGVVVATIEGSGTINGTTGDDVIRGS
jgi:hypothetical protein